MRTALVGVLDEYQLTPLTLSPSINSTCSPEPLPSLTQDTSYPLLRTGTSTDNSKSVGNSIVSIGVDTVIRITEFESPSDPLTNFEIKYSNAERKLYDLNVNLCLNTLSDRERILNIFK